MTGLAASLSGGTIRLKAARGLRPDWGLLFVVLTLLIIGLVMVYSSSYHFGFTTEEGSATAKYLVKQAAFGVGGLVLMWIASRVDYHFYQQRRLVLGLLLGTLALQIPLAIMAQAKGEAIRHLLGQLNSVQPSEMMKLSGVLYIAVWLNGKRAEMRTISLGLIPFATLLALIAVVIVAQRHFSTTMLFVFTATAMLFAIRVDTKQVIIFLSIVALFLVLLGIADPYRVERLVAWWQNPLNDATDEGFQGVQSLMALSNGKAFGVGLGQSQQKFALFASHTDCIFAIIGEEFGFFGSLVVVGLYGLWTWQGFRIASNAPDLYGRLVAVGLVSYITLQAMLHIGVISGLTPFTGTVLPFVSYGGSSLVTCLIAVGILMNIGRGGGGLGQGFKP